MLIETIFHGLTFNLVWFAELILGNLLWLFIFAAAGVFHSGRGALAGGIFLAIYVYAALDIANFLGWVFAKGIFIVIVLVFLGLLFYDSFFEKRRWHIAKRGIVVSALFWGFLMFVNVLG